MCDIVLRDSENLALQNDFEPHPEHLIRRPEYKHEFRNIWLNSRARDLPIRHR